MDCAIPFFLSKNKEKHLCTIHGHQAAKTIIYATLCPCKGEFIKEEIREGELL